MIVSSSTTEERLQEPFIDKEIQVHDVSSAGTNKDSIGGGLGARNDCEAAIPPSRPSILLNGVLVGILLQVFNELVLFPINVFLLFRQDLKNLADPSDSNQSNNINDDDTRVNDIIADCLSMLYRSPMFYVYLFLIIPSYLALVVVRRVRKRQENSNTNTWAGYSYGEHYLLQMMGISVRVHTCVDGACSQCSMFVYKMQNECKVKILSYRILNLCCELLALFFSSTGKTKTLFSSTRGHNNAPTGYLYTGWNLYGGIRMQLHLQ